MTKIKKLPKIESNVTVHPTKAGYQIYKLNGKRLPSVTTVIGGNLGWNKQALLYWQANLFRQGKDPDKVKEEACDIGTLTHNMIEHHVYGAEEIDVTEIPLKTIMTAKRGLEAYVKWEKENKVEYIESEFPMGSESLKVAGTCDAIAYVNGVLTLVDFKTSKSIYGDNIIQLGAYREMFREVTGVEVEQSMLIHIKKDDDLPEDVDRVSAHVISEEMVDKGFEMFVDLRKFYGYQTEMNKFIKDIAKQK